MTKLKVFEKFASKLLLSLEKNQWHSISMSFNGKDGEVFVDNVRIKQIPNPEDKAVFFDNFEFVKIAVGQIWEVVTEDFLTSGDGKGLESRPIKIRSGEKIEIRFPYAWHFRTIDDHYLHAESVVIKDNCKLFGTVKKDIKMQNKAKLEEILRLKLYDPT